MPPQTYNTTLAVRQQALDSLLHGSRGLWHPQPFCDIRPRWCIEYPDLLAGLLALDDDVIAHLNNDPDAALEWLTRYFPELGELAALIELPAHKPPASSDQNRRWAWEIPGRKQQQIEAFVAATQPATYPILDWCAGKGHLGRRLALQWGIPVTSLEIDPVLCEAGRQLADRARAEQKFACKNALTVTDTFFPAQQAVALHACGDLHRHLILQAAQASTTQLDIAPCCYYRGVTGDYQPLSGALQTRITRDDARLAVTETVTASPRLRRQHDQEMAWKLAFDLLRREMTGDTNYRRFKPVPALWFRGEFSAFVSLMAEREKITLKRHAWTEFEQAGWRRQREVMRLSVVRHAFRRALEVLLVQDLGRYLETQGYEVAIRRFCARELTPRNLLISARYG